MVATNAWLRELAPELTAAAEAPAPPAAAAVPRRRWLPAALQAALQPARPSPAEEAVFQRLRRGWVLMFGLLV
jgi:hypothetical protein